MTDLNTWWVFFISSCIVFSLVYFIYKKIALSPTYDLVISDGWIGLDWSTVKRDKTIAKYMDAAQVNFDNSPTDWIEDFTKMYCSKIHYSDKLKLILTSKYLFEQDIAPTEEVVVSTRRLLTVSAICFNFKIPYSLWLLDSITMEIVIKYKHLTSVKVVHMEELSLTEGKVYTLDKKEIVEFKKLVDDSTALFAHVIKLKYSDFYPNMTYLYNHVKKIDPGLFKSLLGDVKTFKRILSVYFILSEIAIPKDYLLIDDYVNGYFDRKWVSRCLKLAN